MQLALSAEDQKFREQMRTFFTTEVSEDIRRAVIEGRETTKDQIVESQQPLNKAGLVETVRGRNGGVRLGRPAEKITLFDVVKVTEDSFAMAECFEDDGDVDCPLIDSCGLNSALRKALNAFFDVLSQYTIDDLVKARPQINFLLGIDDLEPRNVRRAPAA